jgi:hypothetical protein
MAWLPEQLMTKTLNNPKMWAQHIKQFVLMTSGIETKSQGEMDKGGRQNYIMTEYSRWLEILMAKFPDAAVHPWLKFTTGTRTTKIDGKYLYRNFKEGLRIYHRDFNTAWEAVLKEGISGKSNEEVSYLPLSLSLSVAFSFFCCLMPQCPRPQCPGVVQILLLALVQNTGDKTR